MANSVDPDEMPRSAASHLGLYCLLRPVCPNIYGKYGTFTLMLSMLGRNSGDGIIQLLTTESFNMV